MIACRADAASVDIRDVSATVFQIKVTLRGIRPPIWRRLRVPSTLTLGQLHQALQIAMGWTNSHMHQFCVGRQYFGVPDPDDLWNAPTISERKIRLDQIAQATARFTYEYDFGDGWTHDILIERAEPAVDAASDRICTDGRRACPPEDCGGPHGYADFVEAVSNPKHPEHDERLEWIGDEWQPEAFDIDLVNKELRPLAARWRPKAAARSRARRAAND